MKTGNTRQRYYAIAGVKVGATNPAGVKFISNRQKKMAADSDQNC